MAQSEKLIKQVYRLASNIILYQLNDPRIKFVTVTKIKLSDDYRYCTIYVSIFGDAADQRTSMRGLKGARGYIQKQLASKLSLRNAPIVRIEQDLTLEKAFHIIKKIDENDEPVEENDKVTEE